MPGKDGTGPIGYGPRTGRGLGPCGLGLRRGFGRGFGFRTVLTKDKEVKILKAELEEIEVEKKEILKRLKDLE